MNNPDLDKLQQFTNYAELQNYNEGDTSQVIINRSFIKMSHSSQTK